MIPFPWSDAPGKQAFDTSPGLRKQTSRIGWVDSVLLLGVQHEPQSNGSPSNHLKLDNSYLIGHRTSLRVCRETKHGSYSKLENRFENSSAYSKRWFTSAIFARHN